MFIKSLDLTITRKETNLEFDMYHKPSTTDTTVNFLSNHPIEYKMAAFMYQISWLYCLPLAPEKKEWELIQLIARNNNFLQNVLQKLNRQIQHKIGYAQTEERQKKKKILDNIHILWTSNKKNHQLIQMHKHRHNLRGHKYITSTHKTQNNKPNTRTWQKRNL